MGCLSTNSEMGRSGAKPLDDKDAQKSQESNGTGMKIIGQQIKKLVTKESWGSRSRRACAT